MKQSLFNQLRSTITPVYERVKKWLLPLLGQWNKRLGVWAQKALDLADHSTVRSHKVMLRVLCGFFALFLLWAAVFSIDEVVHVQGQIMPSSGNQIIQAADGGVLSQLLVKEGDEVEKGQVLGAFEKDRANAAYLETLGRVAGLRLSVERLEAEIAGTGFKVPEEINQSHPDLAQSQKNLFERRRQGYVEQIKILNENFSAADEEFKSASKLMGYGDISKSEFLRYKKAANDAKSALIGYKSRYIQDASAELNKAKEELNSHQEILRDRSQVLEHTEIRSPEKGIVKSIRVTTLGGVIRQGEEVMQIFPTNGALVVEARVRPVDMAMMKVGLPAKVKLDAYDSAAFGALDGKVVYVSADSLSGDPRLGQGVYYQTRIAIDSHQLSNKNIEVKPGMTVSVDVKNGSRSIMSYLMRPVIKSLDNSMGER